MLKQHEEECSLSEKQIVVLLIMRTNTTVARRHARNSKSRKYHQFLKNDIKNDSIMQLVMGRVPVIGALSYDLPAMLKMLYGNISELERCQVW